MFLEGSFLNVTQNRGVNMITSRQKMILEQLIQHQNFITVAELAGKYQVSPRTIRHDILSLESFLKENDIQLTRNRKNGLKIEVNSDQWQKLKDLIKEGGSTPIS